MKEPYTSNPSCHLQVIIGIASFYDILMGVNRTLPKKTQKVVALHLKTS